MPTAAERSPTQGLSSVPPDLPDSPHLLLSGPGGRSPLGLMASWKGGSGSAQMQAAWPLRPGGFQEPWPRENTGVGAAWAAALSTPMWPLLLSLPQSGGLMCTGPQEGTGGSLEMGAGGGGCWPRPDMVTVNFPCSQRGAHSNHSKWGFHKTSQRCPVPCITVLLHRVAVWGVPTGSGPQEALCSFRAAATGTSQLPYSLTGVPSRLVPP